MKNVTFLAFLSSTLAEYKNKGKIQKDNSWSNALSIISINLDYLKSYYCTSYLYQE